MGVYYHYFNFSKRERFAIDALGGNSKWGGIGRTLAARAFELMLVGVPHDRSPAPGGRWAFDSVAVVGDDTMPIEQWERLSEEFVDVSADAIAAVFRADGFAELGAAAEREDRLFLQLCYLVATRQLPALEPFMRQRFGDAFLKRYKALTEKHPRFVAVDLRAREGE